MKFIQEIIKLCLVTRIPKIHTELQFPQYLSFVKEAVRAGVTMVQYREKEEDRDTIIFHASLLKKALQKYNVPLIINDHVDVAKAIDATGVHLGQTDISPIIARKILGPEKIIGLSVENLEQVLESNRLDIDYISASGIFQTKNKSDAPVLGLELLKKISILSIHPTMAIGGINEDNASEVIQAGAKGIAVIGAIHDSDDHYYTSQHLLGIVDNFLQYYE